MLHEKLVGEIDINRAEAFKNEFTDKLNAKKTGVIFDCEGLTFVDSTGLSAFVSLAKIAKGYDSTVKLVGLKPTIKRLFEITNLNEVVEIE